jgi:transposase
MGYQAETPTFLPMNSGDARQKQPFCPTMAPNLAASQHQLIGDMILSRSLKQTEMAAIAGCSERAIRRMVSNLRLFGKTKAPWNSAGRRRIITPQMLDALYKRLLKKPELYRDEMAVFLYDEFDILVTVSSISRALASIKWSRKATRHVAKKRNTDLRDFYLHSLSNFRSYHLVYVNESGYDKRIGFRRTGWSPIGMTPVQVTSFHRDRKYQILPAYTQNSILLSRVFQRTTDSALFENFIEQLLHHCGRWPEPKSVLIIDNASFHHNERIEQMCLDARVKLLYLPPYSPDLNPIEKFFAELKAFIKKQWHEYEDNLYQDFRVFLNGVLVL